MFVCSAPPSMSPQCSIHSSAGSRHAALWPKASPEPIFMSHPIEGCSVVGASQFNALATSHSGLLSSHLGQRALTEEIKSTKGSCFSGVKSLGSSSAWCQVCWKQCCKEKQLAKIRLFTSGFLENTASQNAPTSAEARKVGSSVLYIKESQ